MKTQTVIVTGASTGIGLAISQLFLERGHNVVLNSVRPDNLDRTFRELASPARTATVAGDVGQREVGEKLVATALERFGRLDTLVNNAGVFEPKPFLDVTEADLDRFLGTNLKGTFFTTQAAIRAMLKSGGGSIINLGTVLVDHAIAGIPATAPIVSKGGIHALTRQLAAEFGAQNIRVNTIAPGVIRSPLQGKIGVADADSLAALHLLGRIGEPADIAEVAYLLATSSFITGEVLNVDGGHVAGHRLA
jgi:NAD(P)-dependent dehydrogenase (short-subunit alcohol dehydrogenase family)